MLRLCIVFSIGESPRVCSKYSHWYYLLLIWGGAKVSSIAIELLLRYQKCKFCNSAAWTTLLLLNFFAGRGCSVGRASAWYAAGRGFHPHVRHTLLEGEWSWNNFYDHYLPSADSRKGSCQLLAKEFALTILVNCLGGLPGNSVDRLTDRARNELKSVEEP